jgi:ATP-dependent DNA helicase
MLPLTLHQQATARASRLNFLLDKSTIYAKIIGDRMARQQIEKAKAERKAATRRANKDKKGEQTATREGMRDKKRNEEAEEKGTTGKRKRKSEIAKDDAKRVKTEEVSTRFGRRR